VAGLLRGDRLSLARAISLVEEGDGGAGALLDALYPRTGGAYRIGVTGPPGAGKSTLVGRVAESYHDEGRRIGVVAVDPSSPFTRGAFLGDRIRFRDLPDDSRLFVRSMASRGSAGGLAYRTGEVCDLLDAFGMEVVLVETVGVGQSELDVAAAVHTTVVVLVPESGDDVQAMKAGLMEIGDLFAVNKADREGAEKVTRSLREMLQLRPEASGPMPPVLPLSALRGEGIERLMEELEGRRVSLEGSGGLGDLKRARAKRRIHELVEEELCARFWRRSGIAPRLDAALARIERGESSPYGEADLLLRSARQEGKGR